MVLSRYYSRFMEGFSKTVHPITYLKKKGIKFEWTLEYEESFWLLKELLTNEPILKSVDPNEDSMVCTNACKEGLCGVLT